MAKQIYSIELEERQFQFLEQMVNQYSLPDVGKAVRCLVDYAVSEQNQQSTIWEQIRCLDC